MFCLTSHRHHQRIDSLFFKVRVVNQRRLEAVCGIANVGENFSIAINHVHIQCQKRFISRGAQGVPNAQAISAPVQCSTTLQLLIFLAVTWRTFLGAG